MTQIGAFTRKEDCFFGRVRTLVFDAEVSILPIDESDTENAPNHRVFCNGMEVGAAWDRTGDRAGAYLSVTIDDPILNQSIRARLFESYTGNSTTDLGEWMELDAVAACVIGGVSLRGGRGTVLGVLAGALIMATLLNGMTLMAVSPEYKLMVRGSVLLAAVWMDVRLGRQ